MPTLEEEAEEVAVDALIEEADADPAVQKQLDEAMAEDPKLKEKVKETESEKAAEELL